MLVYLKSAVWDLLLCILASCALAFTICSGFYSTQGFQILPNVMIVVGLCALITVALFAATLNRRVMPFASIGLGIVLIVGIVVAVSTSAAPAALDDVEGNNLYIALIVVLTPVAVFLLSRRKLLAIVLLCLGVVICGVIEYLYWYGHVVSFLLFIVAVVGLYAYRSYQVSLMNSESDSLAFMSVSLSTLVFAGVSVLVAFGIAAFVIVPLGPPNIVVKLITEHYRADEIEVKGVGALDDLLNNENTTDETNDDTENSSNEDDSDNGGDESDEDNASENEGGSIFGRISMLLPPWTPIALIVFIVVAAIAAVMFKRHRRVKAFTRMLADGNGPAIEQLYLFFLERFERFKIPAPDTLTLTEYASGFAETFNKFERGADTPMFSKLTKIYNDWVFGGNEVNDDDCALFKDYYKAFYKNAVGYVGRLRYCLLFFFI